MASVFFAIENFYRFLIAKKHSVRRKHKDMQYFNSLIRFIVERRSGIVHSYEEKITEYVYKYTDMIARICCLNLKNLSDSDDVVQDIFIKCLKYKPVFKDEQHEMAWFIRVTINLCRDYNKCFWNKNMENNQEKLLELEAKSENLTLLNEVRKLPEKYANVIYLYYYEGYKVKEIAELIGKKENTVLSLLRRGKKLLKSRMEE